MFNLRLHHPRMYPWNQRKTFYFHLQYLQRLVHLPYALVMWSRRETIFLNLIQLTLELDLQQKVMASCLTEIRKWRCLRRPPRMYLFSILQQISALPKNVGHSSTSNFFNWYLFPDTTYQTRCHGCQRVPYGITSTLDIWSTTCPRN